MTEIDVEHIDHWPQERQVYLTLDLECDYGTAVTSNSFHAAQQTDALVSVLEQYNVPLTCFLQTEILDRYPQAIQSLEDGNFPVEFHAHSHTHPRRTDADLEFEVEESVSRVRNQFNTTPVGFRFPDGAVTTADYTVLDDHGISFNASLFPSWRPSRFNNIRSARHPFRHAETGVIELPFTVHSKYIRIPVALSYLKLLGRPFEELVYRVPPAVIVFDLHMHDAVVPPVFDELSPFYRTIYSRRQHSGFEIFERFISTLMERGYTFDQMTNLYHTVQEALTNR